MVQYYHIILGDETGVKKELYDTSRILNYGEVYNLGHKLLEHGMLNNYLSFAMANELKNRFRRVLWVGDYAIGLTKGVANPPEASHGELSYYERVRQNVGEGVAIPTVEDAWSKETKKQAKSFDSSYLEIPIWKDYFLINKDKKEYLELSEYIHRSVYQCHECFCVINPLSLLTAVGNGLGFGDYYGRDSDMVGTWAWNLISLAKEVPDGYTKIMPTFTEGKE